MALALVAAVFLAGYEATRRLTARRAPALDNSKKAVGTLFTVPLIAAAALLSFAHGANDVANAIGPLAAIRSEEHTSELQSLMRISYAVFCLKKKITKKTITHHSHLQTTQT